MGGTGQEADQTVNHPKSVLCALDSTRWAARIFWYSYCTRSFKIQIYTVSVRFLNQMDVSEQFRGIVQGRITQRKWPVIDRWQMKTQIHISTVQSDKGAIKTHWEWDSMTIISAIRFPSPLLSSSPPLQPFTFLSLSLYLPLAWCIGVLGQWIGTAWPVFFFSFMLLLLSTTRVHLQSVCDLGMQVCHVAKLF